MSWLIIFGATACAVLVFILRPFISVTRSIPGPFWAKWSDLWYLRAMTRGDFEKQSIRLHERHGSLVRYGPNRYSVRNVDAVNAIYKHGAQFPKSSWYDAWAPPGSWSIFSDRNVHRHAQDRRLFQHTYSMSSLLNYEHYIDECTDVFQQRLVEMAAKGEVVDMRHWFQCYAFDVVAMITFAKRLGFLDRGEDVEGIIHSLEDHVVYGSLAGIFPWTHKFLYPLRNKQAGKNGAGRGHILTFAAKCLDGHLSERQEKAGIVTGEKDSAEPFLSKFVTRFLAEPQVFTRHHVIVGCTANMVAGSDTTAISLSAALFYLLRNPECLQTLREEVEAFTARGQLSAKPTFREVSQLPYLQAVVKESLRLHPAVGLPLERVVPEGGVEICGKFLPAGSIVGINPWTMHYDPSVFGEDAHKFNPSRWLNSSPSRIEFMNRYWMPFGLGSRTCLGRHISMLEMSKALPRLLRDFDFQLANDYGPNESWATTNYWFVKPTDFQVRVRVVKPLVQV